MARNNEVKVTGNLGTDAEVITTGKSPFAVFPLYTQDSYKKDGQWIDKEPDIHDIMVFGESLIEHARLLKKGYRVEVIGEIKYQIKERDGVKYKEARIHAKAIKDATLTQSENAA